MSISLILTPFDHFHFRPTSGLLSSQDLAYCLSLKLRHHNQPWHRENSEDQTGLSSYPVGSDFLHRVARNATIGAEGCPIGVQVIIVIIFHSDLIFFVKVVGRHYQEELVIHAMKEVERLVKSNWQTFLMEIYLWCWTIFGIATRPWM